MTDRARLVLSALAPALLVFGFDLVYEPEYVTPVGGAARYDGLSIPALVLPGALGLAAAIFGLILVPKVHASGWATRMKRLAGWCGLAMLLATLTAALVGELPIPQSPVLVLMGALLGVLSAAGLGAVIATLIPAASPSERPEALIGAISFSLFWPLVFIAGIFAYPPLMSDTMQRVAGFMPIGAAVQAMQLGWFGPGFPDAPGPGLLVAVGIGWTILSWGFTWWRGGLAQHKFSRRALRSSQRQSPVDS